MKKLVMIIAAALLALSCAEDEGTTPPAHPEATTPVNCLKCVEISFTQRAAVLLDDMLGKSFVFHFDDYDVGRNPPGGSKYVIPETWSETEFRRAARNMVDEAYSISFVIPTEYVGEPGPEETFYEARNVRIKLLVMVDELNGYIADMGYCNFEFERYDGADGEKLWRLTAWWDYTAAWGDVNPGARPSSFGEIISKFY